MMMEPDEQQPEYSVVRSESRVVYSQPTSSSGFQPMIPPSIIPSIASIPEDVSDGRSVTVLPSPAMVPQPAPAQSSQNPEVAEQNFLPSFFRSSPPLGHSRPYTHSNNAAAIAGRYSTGARATQEQQSLLGSGDFSVIRGGTYYPEGEKRPTRTKIDGYQSAGSSFYNNGHGRPNAQPLTAPKQQNEDPFSNFRDFADINVGSDPAYSHFVVVYANKNSTSSHPNPKNIFEQLQLLDEEDFKQKEEEPEQKYSKKYSKLSKFKTKLAKTKFEKKYQKKLSPKESLDQYSDPLLAES